MIKQYNVEIMKDGAIRCSSWDSKQEDVIFDKEDKIEDLNILLKMILKRNYAITVISEIE